MYNLRLDGTLLYINDVPFNPDIFGDQADENLATQVGRSLFRDEIYAMVLQFRPTLYETTEELPPDLQFFRSRLQNFWKKIQDRCGLLPDSEEQIVHWIYKKTSIDALVGFTTRTGYVLGLLRTAEITIIKIDGTVACTITSYGSVK